MKRWFKLIGIVSLLFMVSGCLRNTEVVNDLRDLKGVTWSPELAAPLINSSLSLADIVKQAGSELVEVDGEGLVHLVYRGDLVSIDANEVLHIADQQFTERIILSTEEAEAFNSNDSVVLMRDLLLNYVVSFGEIDSVHMRYMKLEQQVSRLFDHDLELQLEYPFITKGNKPLQTPFFLSGSANTNKRQLDLFSYFMDMSKGNSGVDQVPVRISCTIRKTGTSSLSAGDMINIDQSFEQHDFDLFYGYCGQQSLFNSEADTMTLNVYNRSSGGSFTINDPRVKLVISNSFGIPAEAKIKELSSYSKSGGFVNITGFPGNITVQAPGQNEVGKTYSDSIILNKNTSNIADVINSKPDRFVYNFEASSNPQGAIRRNFAHRNSALIFRLDLDFPLKGTADNYNLEQEQDFDFNPGEGVEFEEVVLRLNLENDFPIDLDLQIYFLAENGNVLDSLFTPRKLLLSSPPVNAEGRTTSSTRSSQDISFGSDRAENLRNAKRYRIVAGFNTTKGSPAQPTVAFYDDYRLKVQLGVTAAIKLIGR